MSQQPDQPNPPSDPTPAGYYAPAVPPYQAPEPEQAQPTVPLPQFGQAPLPYGQPVYQQQPYPVQQNYGQPYPGQPYPSQVPAPYPTYVSGPRGLSLSSMIIGLASLLIGFGFLVAPQIVGIILGHMSLSREMPQGRGFAITGLITNYLSLVIYGGFYAFFFYVIFATGSSY